MANRVRFMCAQNVHKFFFDIIKAQRVRAQTQSIDHLIWSDFRPIIFSSNFRIYPSSIYSWSIGHILEHEFFCLGHLGCAGSRRKKVDLSFSEQLLRVVFSTFWGKKKFQKIFKNILATTLKSYIK